MRPPVRTIWRADNLKALAQLDDRCVDLFYVDPPFGTMRTWEGRREAAGTGFTDRWNRDAKSDAGVIAGTRIEEAVALLHSADRTAGAWAAMLGARLLQIERTLKTTGSVWLHCDDRGEGAARLLADLVFGARNRRNSVRWRRHNAHGGMTRRCARIVDTIFWYAGSEKTKWRGGHHSYTEAQRKRYRYRDSDGRAYKCENLTNPRPGTPDRDFEWRGTRPGNGWRFDRETLERLYQAGRIQLKRDGTPRTDGHKVFLDEARGPALQDLWTDMPGVTGTDRDATGFPTQKPVPLLKRIIAACTDAGDLVVDPFAGSGTTAVAAESMGRDWLLIERNKANAALAASRLENVLGMFGASELIDTADGTGTAESKTA